MSSAKKSLDFIKKMSESMVNSKRFDSVLQKVKITGGGDGNCTAEFTVAEEHLNRRGGLHGGFTAALVDNVTTYALMSNASHPEAGVSVDLYVSYLKGAKQGDEIIVEAKTIKSGKSLAFLECELRHKTDGSLIAKGGQTQFVNL